MDFGEKIDYLMIKNNLKYATEFAQNVGLSSDTINQYRKKVTPEGIEAMKIKRIAEYFNVSIDYFFETMDSKENNTTINEFKYIKTDEDSIDVELFISEVNYILKNKELILDNNILNDEKKYIIDSLEIGYKLLKNNI